MKRISLLNLFASVLVLFACALMGSGQAPEGDLPDGPPQNQRASALRDLGLSPEQRQQIRRINQERRAGLEGANRRVREAMKALDEAIYADQTDDAVVRARVAEFQAAQSEATSLRFEKEVAIRKVLTAEQLVRFREIRRKFQEFRENRQDGFRGRRGPRDQRPADGSAPPMRQFMKRGKRRPII